MSDPVTSGLDRLLTPDEKEMTRQRFMTDHAINSIMQERLAKSVSAPFFWKATKHLSTVEASFIVMNFLISMNGILSLPYIFKQSGSLGVIAFLLSIAFSLFTAWLLGLLLESRVQDGDMEPTYQKIGSAAFGTTFASFMSIVVLLDCATFAVMNCIIIGINAHIIVPGLSVRFLIFSTAVLAAVLHSIPDKVFSYIAAFSTSIAISVGALIIATGAMLPEFAGAPSLVVDGARGLAGSYIFGLFCSGYHVFYPAIFARVESRESYNRAMLIGHTVSILVMVPFGILALYIFGNALQPVITTNAARDLDLQPLPGLDWMASVIGIFVAIKNFFTLKPVVEPMIKSSYELLNLNPASKRIAHATQFANYAFLGFLAVFMADAIIALESAVAGCIYVLVAFVFPSASYLRLMKAKPATVLCITGILCLGVVTALVEAAFTALKLV